MAFLDAASVDKTKVIAPHQDTSHLKKVVVSSMIGNALEWYDFALYGYFSTLLAKLFFPSSDAVVSLMATYGVFAAGFFMRPLGGIIFGYIGDKMGRKKALLWSIYLMSFPTFAIACLPTYEHIAWGAPLLLTLIRLLQGLSMGGEFTGSIIFIVEHAEGRRRGFWGSFAPLSAILGILIGSGLAAFLSYTLDSEQLSAWGWRVPFALSLFGGWLGSYMRKTLGDPKTFEKSHKKNGHKKSNLYRDLFSHHKKSLLTVFLIDLLVAIGFYVIVTFLVGYLEQFVGLNRTQALTLSTVSMCAFALGIVCAGYFVDQIGRKSLMTFSAISFVLFSVPLFEGFLSGNLYVIAFCQASISFLMGTYFAVIPAVLVESFPTRVRYSGISIAHNLSMAIFGGSAPFVVTWMISFYGSLVAPAFYLIAASLGALAGLLMLKDRTLAPLD